MKYEASKSRAIVVTTAITGALVAGIASSQTRADNIPAVESESIELAFMTHLDADMAEQDIYIEREHGSGEVFRVTNADNNMNAPLYKTAVAVKHNPFDPAAIGPYPKGEPMGMTLGQWLRHQGSGVYSCNEGQGQLETQFTGLVPDGVYTMWHAFIALPPTTPFSGTLDLPLGARDGSDSIFRADENGEASFVRTFSPCLEMSDVWTTSMLAVNYHSNGKTYAAYPGDFGLNAHIPLFMMLPKRQGIE